MFVGMSGTGEVLVGNREERTVGAAAIEEGGDVAFAVGGALVDS